MSKLAMLGGEKVRNKPFVNYAIMGEKERERINNVLESGMLSGFVAQAGDNFLGGKYVREYEALVEEYFDARYAVSVNSATAALHIAVGACGIGPGDEVIVTPYSMCASATCVLMQNAIPVFVDIEEDSFCIDPKKMENAITLRTRAIVVVHLFGRPANMDEIIRIARENNLYVIEDSAQSPGATYKGRLAGTIGDIGVFSLNQHKTITCGEGGFAITSDKDLALKMQLIRNHGEVVVGDMNVENIENIVGFNYRMTELESAVAIEQFKKLDFLNNHRIELAEYLTERLLRFNDLILPQIDKADKHVYFVYPIRIKVDAVEISRDIIVKALQAEGIPFGGGYVKPIYLEPIYQKKIAYGKNGCPFSCKFFEGEVNYKKGICPVSERLYEKELILTSVCKYPHTEDDMNDVVEAFGKVFDGLEELKNITQSKNC